MGSKTIDQVVLKFPFNNPLFQESEILLRWPFSNTILITAFDLFRNDTLVTKLQKTGSTIKDYLKDFGFNSKVNILADTGIFELEARKARLHLIDKHSIDLFSLEPEEIFDAYSLIDPDFLVAPDDMILLNDDTSTQLLKLENLMNNLDKTLELFPKNKIVATIQGLNLSTIDQIVSKIHDEKLNFAARGGLLPLRRESRKEFSRILKLTEQILKSKQNNIHLHAFGLGNVNMLYDYFEENSYSSVDTSAIYYYTLDRKYLTDKCKFIQVRKANFEMCGCEGCEMMKDNLSYANYNSTFIIGLYTHNAFQTISIVKKIQTKQISIRKKKKLRQKRYPRYFKKSNVNRLPDKDMNRLITAAEYIKIKKRVNNQSKSHIALIKKIKRRSKRNSIDYNKDMLIVSSGRREKSIKRICSQFFDNINGKDQSIKPLNLFGVELNEINTVINGLRKNYLIDHLICAPIWGLLDESKLNLSYFINYNFSYEQKNDHINSSGTTHKTIKELIGNNYYRLILFLPNPSNPSYSVEFIDKLLAHTKELIFILTSKNIKEKISDCVNYFSIEEFYDIQWNHDLRFELPHLISDRFSANGPILRNFSYFIDKFKPVDLSFLNWYHTMFNCNCEEKQILIEPLG